MKIKKIGFGFGLIGYLSLFQLCQAQNIAENINNSSSNGLGGVSSAFNDIRGLVSNPSTIGSINSVQAFLYADQRFGLKELSTYSLAMVVPLNSGSLGLSIGRYGFNLYNENSFQASYGRKILNNLTIGGSISYRNLNIREYGNAGVLGFQLGISSKVTSTTDLYFSVTDPHRTKVNEYDRYPGFFILGGAYSPGKKVIVRAEINKTLENKEDIRFGLEYLAISRLILRLGGHTNPGQYSFGFGILPDDHFSIDASAKYDPTLGLLPSLGVSYGVKYFK